MSVTAVATARSSRKCPSNVGAPVMSQADQDIASMRKLVQQASKDRKTSLELLVAAGILAKAGNLTKPYR